MSTVETIVSLVILIMLASSAIYFALRAERGEDAMRILVDENKRLRAELAERPRLMQEQFELKVAAMYAGKAMLQEAALALREEQLPAPHGGYHSVVKPS